MRNPARVVMAKWVNKWISREKKNILTKYDGCCDSLSTGCQRGQSGGHFVMELGDNLRFPST